MDAVTGPLQVPGLTISPARRHPIWRCHNPNARGTCRGVVRIPWPIDFTLTAEQRQLQLATLHGSKATDHGAAS
jgi:hypothetical protein